jgi:3D (Asp-Asp-Asp) domain-containing protein
MKPLTRHNPHTGQHFTQNFRKFAITLPPWTFRKKNIFVNTYPVQFGMKKQLKRQRWALVTLQIAILFCGIHLWYGSGILCSDHRLDSQGVDGAYNFVIANNDNEIAKYDNTLPHKEMSLPAAPSSIVVSSSLNIVTPNTVSEKVVEMSAYTSRIEETDESPCISADGTNICEYDGCVVASNDYALGTKIVVEGFGECEVKDRMNSRYTGQGNMDIYFGMDLKGALEFGRKKIKIAITS